MKSIGVSMAFALGAVLLVLYLGVMVTTSARYETSLWIASECKSAGRFTVDRQVFECKEKK